MIRMLGKLVKVMLGLLLEHCACLCNIILK
jgi:hypothetical protein